MFIGVRTFMIKIVEGLPPYPPLSQSPNSKRNKILLIYKLKNYKFIIYDDIKLYIRVCSIDDCMKLQDDFNSFSEWFKTLG